MGEELMGSSPCMSVRCASAGGCLNIKTRGHRGLRMTALFHALECGYVLVERPLEHLHDRLLRVLVARSAQLVVAHDGYGGLVPLPGVVGEHLRTGGRTFEVLLSHPEGRVHCQPELRPHGLPVDVPLARERDDVSLHLPADDLRRVLVRLARKVLPQPFNRHIELAPLVDYADHWHSSAEGWPALRRLG